MVVNRVNKFVKYHQHVFLHVNFTISVNIKNQYIEFLIGLIGLFLFLPLYNRLDAT